MLLDEAFCRMPAGPWGRIRYQVEDLFQKIMIAGYTLPETNITPENYVTFFGSVLLCLGYLGDLPASCF